MEKALRRADVAAARHTRPEPGVIFRDIDAPWCPEMVVIPRGEFLMASPGARDAKEPRHLVRIAYPLAVGRYPVTFEEYHHFCEKTRRQHPSDEERGHGPRPVIKASWNDAKAYAAWLSEETGKLYRLPKEAEWEYAARAGADTHWVTDPHFRGFVWTEEDDERLPTTPIDAFTPHPWGILGIYSEYGGIWEWCEESWNDPIRGPVRTGRRVACCFGWLSDPPWLGTLVCFDFDADPPRDLFGFRVVRPLAR